MGHRGRRDRPGHLAARLGARPGPAGPALRPGLAFMVCNFPDEVDTNLLTIEANDPIAGTAEFKATAIKVEKLTADAPVGWSGHAQRRWPEA